MLRTPLLAALAAAALLLPLAGVPAHAAAQRLTPTIRLRVQARHGVAGDAQRITGSVRFHDPYADATFPVGNGTAVLQRRPPGAARWTKVEAVSGEDAGAPVFRHVRRLTRTLRYRLCYRGGDIVTYDAQGREVDLPVDPGCGRPVSIRVSG